MERFVRSIVAGGLVLVGALWLTALTDSGSAPWLAGLVLALCGTGAVLAGIWSELDL